MACQHDDSAHVYNVSIHDQMLQKMRKRPYACQTSISSCFRVDDQLTPHFEPLGGLLSKTIKNACLHWEQMISSQSDKAQLPTIARNVQSAATFLKS